MNLRYYQQGLTVAPGPNHSKLLASSEHQDSEEPARPRRKRAREEPHNDARVSEAYEALQDELLSLQDGVAERIDALRSRLLRFFEEERSMGQTLSELLVQRDHLYISRMTFLGRTALKHYTAEFLRQQNFMDPHFLTQVRSKAYGSANLVKLLNQLGVEAVLGVNVAPNHERFYQLLAELDQFSKESNEPNNARSEARIEAAQLRDQLVEMLFRISTHRVDLTLFSDRILLQNHKRVKY